MQTLSVILLLIKACRKVAIHSVAEWLEFVGYGQSATVLISPPLPSLVVDHSIFIYPYFKKCVLSYVQWFFFGIKKLYVAYSKDSHVPNEHEQAFIPSSKNI